MKRIIKYALLIVFSNFILNFATAQKKDSSHLNLKNTIKFNVSSPIIFGSKTFTFGFERVLNKRQSLSINIGHTAFPSLNISSTDSFNVSRTNADKGFHFSAEYRFYLDKENKYNAPRGIYLAPYYSYNSFERNNTWNIRTGAFTGNVNTDLALKVHTIGLELGYQFILWKKVSLDFILAGPGIASYNLNAQIGSNLSPGDKLILLQKINEALTNRIPGYGLVLGDTEFNKTGVVNTSGLNFRYLMQIGFRF